MTHAPDAGKSTSTPLTLPEVQQLIRSLYHAKDEARGIPGTFMWFMEEVGELSSALKNGTHEERVLEFADVLAWLSTLANLAGVDLAEALSRKYGHGCPGCSQLVCICAISEKP